MKRRAVFLGMMVAVVASSGVAAQTPVLGDIEAPYANIQTTVHVAGGTYGPGAVAYGPAGTPLVLTGSDLGATGVVQFVGYKNGAVDPGTTVQGTATLWTSNMIFVPVPSGAVSGLVSVIVEGKTSNGVPFIVTPGAYAGTCPSFPPTSQLQITTSSLHDGTAGQSYSATLGAAGGTGAYAWSIAANSLPSGVSLNASTGTISGTPTGAAGPIDLTIQVTDSGSPRQTNDAVLSLTIQPQAMTPKSGMYTYSANYDGVGNVTSFSDSVNGTWNMVAGSGTGYDTLNRLFMATETPISGPALYFCWSYDSFGNRTQQEISSAAFQSGSGGANQCNPQPSATVATDLASYASNNQITSTNARGVTAVPTYDGAGNVLSDGANTYLYDPEGRICAVKSAPLLGVTSMTGYLYDAQGTRVAKGTISTWGSCDPAANGFQLTETYVLGQGGQQLSMFDGSGNWQRSNVYGAGRLLATYDMIPDPTSSSPTQVSALHFHLTDPLGTRRMQISSVGQPETDCQSLPFGDQQYCFADQYAPPTADDATPIHFTGKERDQESGNDYFGARYYASTMGRYLSPDWSVIPEAVPYADLENPQTLNLYAYVQNNPLTFHDATGHYHCDPDTSSTNANGDMVVTAGACHFDWSDFPQMAVAVGHHFIPKQIWSDINKASDAYKFLNKVTTRALKNPRLSNPFDRLHRALNRNTEELVRDLEKQLGKSIEDFNKGDFQELSARIERAGGDIETFNARMQALEPEARTFGEAVAEALEEVFPAAANAAEATAPLAGEAAEGAAEIP